MAGVYIMASSRGCSDVCVVPVLTLLVLVETDKHGGASGADVKGDAAASINAPLIVADDVAHGARAAVTAEPGIVTGYLAAF